MLCTALTALCWPLGAQPVLAQPSTPPASRLPELPFEKWMAEGEREEIDWTVTVSRPRLSVSQRMIVFLTVSVGGKQVARSGPRHEYFFLVGVREREASWWPERGLVAARVDTPISRRDELQFNQQVYLLPGEYTLGLVLFDRVTGQRSTAQKKLRVPPLKNDPLPDASRTLPRVEFLQPERAVLRGVPEEIRSEMWLPVTSRRRLELEVIVNFTPTVELTGRRRGQEQNLGLMIGMLRVLSQLEPANGSLHLAALDLERQRVAFEQRNARELDFAALRRAMASLNPNVVNVRDLSRRLENPAFFRDYVGQRLRAPLEHPAADGSDGSSNPPPMRVLILASSLVQFEYRSNLTPLPAIPDCNCRIYHLQYRLGFGNVWDDIPRLLANQKVKRFTLNNPEDFRRALARILTELRAL